MEEMKYCPSMLMEAYRFYGGGFWKAFEYYSRFGHVYIDSGAFAMMRPCRRDAPFNFCFPDDADCWYVDYVYGEGSFPRLMQITRALNPDIKTICFTRSRDQKDIRFYDMDRFGRKI